MGAEDFDVDLLNGVGQLLAAEGVGTWRNAGIYAAGETAIVIGGLPQTPDRAVGIVSYGVTDDPSLSDSVVGLQITTRWAGQDPRDVARLTTRVFNALHGRINTDLPTGIHVPQILRRSWTSIGQDGNSRWRTVQNFYADVHRPTPHRV